MIEASLCIFVGWSETFYGKVHTPKLPPCCTVCSVVGMNGFDWDGLVRRGRVRRGRVRGLVSGLVQRGLVRRGWYEWVGLGWRGGG